MIPAEAVEAAARAMAPAVWGPSVWQFAAHGESPTDARNRVQQESLQGARRALESAAPYILKGDVEWTVFRASDGPNGSPAENLRYSTKAGAQESIDSRYSTPELWEPRQRIVGAWHK